MNGAVVQYNQDPDAPIGRYAGPAGRGAGRTGALCAIYRIAVMNWTREKAIEEMTRGDFGFHAIFNTSLVPFLRSIDI